MADIVATVGRVKNKLSQLVTEEALLHIKVGEDVSILNQKLTWLRSFLECVGERGRDSRNQMEALWIKQATEVMFEAEDTLDEFSAMAENAKLSSFSQRWKALLKFQWATQCFEQILVNHKLLKKIEALKQKLEELDNQRTTHQIQFDSSSWQVPSINQGVSIWDGRDSYEPVGAELHVNELKDQLLNGEKKRKFIAIIGSGNGVSSFGKKLYDSPEIKGHFEVLAWKNLPVKFSLNEIFSGIYYKVQEQMDQDEVDSCKREDNSEALCALLRKRRYLVVLNGIACQDDWDDISNFLPDEENGSRVLLIPKHESETAVSSESADIVTIKPAVSLNLQGCTELFSEIVFGNRNESANEIGVFIPKVHAITKGNPWSITLLGLILRAKLSAKLWKKVFSYLESSTARNPVDRVLPLSFDSLPQQMKSCFLYFAAMPENIGFQADRLVRIWIAEGFIESRYRKTPEEVGEGYIKDLISRSLVHIVEKDENGGIAVVAVNDRIHAFLQSVAQGSSFVTVCDNVNLVSPGMIRRLAIQNYVSKYVQVKRSSPKLRAFMCECREEYPTHQPGHTMKFLLESRFLRVIELHGLIIKKLPKEMGKLIHLRYLGVHCKGLHKLPRSISKLLNLQTLDIKETPVENLPKLVWGIEALRHIIADGVKLAPEGVGRLNYLQTLRTADCSKWKHIKYGLLEKMINIRSISLEQLTTSQGIAISNSLGDMAFLRNLCLKSKEDHTLPSSVITNTKLRSLEILELHGKLEDAEHEEEELEEEEDEAINIRMPKLMSLTLTMSQIEQQRLVNTVCGIRSLKRLSLRKAAYQGRNLRFRQNENQKLEELELRELGELRELSDLPLTLRKLTLSGCTRLENLTQGMQALTQLQELIVYDMDKLITQIRNRQGDNFESVKEVKIIKTRLRRSQRGSRRT